MTSIGLSNEELETVRQHHDMLIAKDRLEQRFAEIRESYPTGAQPEMLKPLETQLHWLDDKLSQLAL